MAVLGWHTAHWAWVGLNRYKNISSSEITAMCFDDRQRKWIIGNQGGQVQVFNGMNGALMKEGTSHKSEVTALCYDIADKCLMSCSWDRRVREHDEGSADQVKALRCVDNAHSGDIGCLAYSFHTSLVATACSNLVIRVWDFQDVSVALCPARAQS